MNSTENTKLQEILSKIETMPAASKEYLNRMFKHAPFSIFDNMVMKQYQRDTIFIKEQTAAEQIYILLEGTVEALEHRILGNKYNYMRFQAIEVFGSMETLLELDYYMTTLMTVSNCTFLIMSRAQYRQWIEKDNNALRMETKSMGRYLLEQARKERLFLFLYGRDRLFLILSDEYKYLHDDKGNYVTHRTHLELSESSGLSVRTINRALQSMRDEGYIQYFRGEIRIDESQYRKMKAYLEDIVAE